MCETNEINLRNVFQQRHITWQFLRADVQPHSAAAKDSLDPEKGTNSNSLFQLRMFWSYIIRNITRMLNVDALMGRMRTCSSFDLFHTLMLTAAHLTPAFTLKSTSRSLRLWSLNCMIWIISYDFSICWYLHRKHLTWKWSHFWAVK